MNECGYTKIFTLFFKIKNIILLIILIKWIVLVTN
jgi:hypothetical protein